MPMKMNPGAESRFFDADGGELGRGSGPDYKEARFTCREVMTATEFTLKVEWETKKKQQAVINATRDAIMDTAKEHARFINYCLIRDDLGRIGTISAVGAVANKQQTLSFKGSTDGFGVRGIRVKDTYRVYSLNGVALNDDKGTIRCLSVDVNANTAKFDTTGLKAGHAVAVADVCVLDGLASGDSPGDVDTYLGVQYHNDDANTGKWLGIDRGDYPQVRANAVDCSGGFTWSAPRQLMNKIGNRLGKKHVTNGTWWCHKDFVDMYESMIREVVQINLSAGQGPVKSTTDPFFSQTSMAGYSFHWLYEWDKSRADWLPQGNMVKAVIQPTHFLKSEGNKRLFWVVSTGGGRKAAKVCYMASMFQTVCERPAAQGFLENLPFNW